MKKLLALIVGLLIAGGAAAQPYTSRYFHYNQYFDAPPPFVIMATTVDGADNNSFYLTGGGASATDGSRGAQLNLTGNETAGKGSMTLRAGNVDGNSIINLVTSANAWISLATASQPRVLIDYSADVDDVDILLGNATPTAPIFTIRARTADADDDGVLRITAGGAYDVNATRGSYISLWANEAGGAGALNLVAGAAAGNGGIYFKTGGNYNRISIPYTADADDAELVFGNNSTTEPVFGIRAATSDADDDGILGITAGGATSGARGAMLWLYGNEKASYGGSVYFQTGYVASRAIYFQTYNGAGSDSNRLTIPTMANVNDVDLLLGEANPTVPIFTIRAQTSDADDDATLKLCTGGACSATGLRGGEIYAYGNEVATVGGVIELRAGNNAFIDFLTGDPDSAVNRTRWRIPTDSSNVNGTFVFGIGGGSPLGTIRCASNDGADQCMAQITGGGSDTVAGTRGAYLQLEGEDYGGTVDGGGNINLVAGLGLSNANYPVITIRHDSADGSDWGETCITAGGACANQNRGAYLQLLGNENASDGALNLYAGDGAMLLSSAQNANGITLSVGTGGPIQFKGAGNAASGQLKNVACEEKTIAVGSGAAGVATATNLCASGIVLAVSARVTQAPGGGATTYDIGCTGSGNLDQFCDGLSTALGTTCTYPTDGDGTNIPWVQKAATTMTVTTDANVTVSDMKLRVCSYYFVSGAPSS